MKYSFYECMILIYSFDIFDVIGKIFTIRFFGFKNIKMLKYLDLINCTMIHLFVFEILSNNARIALKIPIS